MGMRIFLLSVLCGLVYSEDLYRGYKVIRAVPQRPSHLRWLTSLQEKRSGLKLDYWMEPSDLHAPVEVMIAPRHVTLVTDMMSEVKMPHEVIIEDVQNLLDADKELNSHKEADFPDRYLTYEEILEWLDKRAAECVDVTCETEIIGQTFEGRDMKLFKMKSDNGMNKRKVWVDAGIHSREWISPATAMNFILRLTQDYSNDFLVQEILDNFDIYILTLINADGYVHTHTTDRLWRKSRTKHPGDTCYGTDINRNFNHNWNGVGTSQDSCSQIYCGPSAESEIEAQNIAAFMKARMGEWEVYLTLHSYSQLWMAPWGFSYSRPDNYEELMRVGGAAVNALTAVHGTQYTLGSASEILYRSSGTSRDWAYGVMNIPYVYTIELRDKGFHGFVLPPDQIVPTGEETYAGFRAMLRAIINKD